MNARIVMSLTLVIGAMGVALAGPAPYVADLSKDSVGAEPGAFAPVVGFWRVSAEQDRKVLLVDGTGWKRGEPSAGLADKARALYGERYAEFLDSVKAYAYFPLAVTREVSDFREGGISLRFKPLRGRIDQAAGIAFNLKPNGDYLVLRANALENNLVLFKYVRGERSPVKWIRNTPTATGQWHALKLIVRGRHIQGFLNGKLLLEDDWQESVSGRVGVWSKADSVVLFDEFTVEASSGSSGSARPEDQR